MVQEHYLLYFILSFGLRFQLVGWASSAKQMYVVLPFDLFCDCTFCLIFSVKHFLQAGLDLYIGTLGLCLGLTECESFSLL